jgi:hypothetical protein
VLFVGEVDQAEVPKPPAAPLVTCREGAIQRILPAIEILVPLPHPTTHGNIADLVLCTFEASGKTVAGVACRKACRRVDHFRGVRTMNFHAVFFAALLIVRFYERFTPRQIGRAGFILCTIALL